MELLAGSDPTGAAIVRSLDNKHYLCLWSCRIRLDTLNREYERDIKKGMDIAVPEIISLTMIQNNVLSYAGVP